MSILEAVILAIVEGITEFLPVSSTGHMILCSAFMGIENQSFTKVFEVSIQLGAILSVVALYIKRFIKDFNFYLILFVGFIPTAILGLLFKPYIDLLLENVIVVAVSLLVGGIILLFVDTFFEKNESNNTVESKEVNLKKAFIIGTIQAIAMIPGVSRSAATIVGGLSQKLNRKTAAEFSFFLAVPTMFAATAKSIWDEKELVLASADKIELLIIGNIVAFIVAMVAIKFFISILTKYGFKIFGYYRIVLGSIILIMILLDFELNMF